jgi:hypothetical protein
MTETAKTIHSEMVTFLCEQVGLVLDGESMARVQAMTMQMIDAGHRPAHAIQFAIDEEMDMYGNP